MTYDIIADTLGIRPMDASQLNDINKIQRPADAVDSRRQDGIYNNNYGKRHSSEAKKLMSERAKARKHHPMSGKKHSDETRQKISLSCKGRISPRKGMEPWNKNKQHSDATKQKISVSKTGRSRTLAERLAISEGSLSRPKYTCAHCSKIVDASNFSRWHGDRCKRANNGS
jgi:hypothetical protein